MRHMILSLSLAASLLAAPAALAAPTCQDKDGVTTRCGTPNAMPVGWSLPPDQRRARPESDLKPNELLSLICIVGGVFALIALMPDFDGWSGEVGDDEDEEEPG